MKIKFVWNYWLYILSGLFPLSILAYYTKIDSLTQEIDVFNIIFQLLLAIFCYSLSWIISKKYDIHYFWTCSIGSGMILFAKIIGRTLISIKAGFFTEHISSLPQLLFLLMIAFLFQTIVMILISYFFHFIYFNLTQILSKNK